MATGVPADKSGRAFQLQGKTEMSIQIIKVAVVLLFLVGCAKQTRTEIQAAANAPELVRIHAPGGGGWGNWGAEEFCPAGSYAAGMAVKYEQPQGRGDDSAANALQLICRRAQDWSIVTGRITSKSERWGNWSADFNCPENTFLFAYQMRVEGPSRDRGFDDTAANGFIMDCRQLSSSSVVPEGRLEFPGDWGDWKDRAVCPEARAIVSIQTRVEDYRRDQDDTALNDVRFSCRRHA